MQLTANEIATADTQLIHALNWHKSQPKNDFTKAEIAKIDALRRKLNEVLDTFSAASAETDGECVVMVTV